MTHAKTPRWDRALLVVAVALMLGGAAALVGDWMAAGLAIPLIAIGIALVAIERRTVQRQHGKHIQGT